MGPLSLHKPTDSLFFSQPPKQNQYDTNRKGHSPTSAAIKKNHYNVNKTGAYSAELSGGTHLPSINSQPLQILPYPVARVGHGKSPTLRPEHM